MALWQTRECADATENAYEAVRFFVISASPRPRDLCRVAWRDRIDRQFRSIRIDPPVDRKGQRHINIKSFRNQPKSIRINLDMETKLAGYASADQPRSAFDTLPNA